MAIQRLLFTCSLMCFTSLGYGQSNPKPEKNTVPKETNQEMTDRVYTLPGIIGSSNGEWVGSDNLYNLPKSLNVVAEVVFPTGKTVPFSSDSIKSQAIAALAKYGIESKNPTAATGSNLPTPFLHLLVMILPLEKGGYVISCNGRLFEQVQNPRVVLEKGIYWQAISWEKQDLLFSTNEKLPEQVKEAVSRIIKSFGERFLFFQTIKNS